MTSIERPVNLSKTEALSLVSAFFPKEWRRLREEDVSVSRSQSGISNEVYFVSAGGRNQQEPDRVAIRKYNQEQEEDVDGLWTAFGQMCASHTEQIVMHVQLAHAGLGPKQYGVFAGGRIEQWVDCRQLTYTDAIDPVVSHDLAVTMARVHALQLPLRKPAYHFIDVLRQMYAGLQSHLSYFDDDEMLRPIAGHDYQSLMDWMAPLLSFRHNRMVFMNWDPHFGNLAVLNRPAAQQLKVMMFDFEVASYNIRGKDLGNFLISRSGFVPDVRTDRRIESNEEFFPFLQAYVDECDKLMPVVDRGGSDSLDHLMMEALLGGIVALLYYLFFQLKVNATDAGRNPVLQTYAAQVPVWFQGLIQCEQALRTRYPDLEKTFS